MVNTSAMQHGPKKPKASKAQRTRLGTVFADGSALLTGPDGTTSLIVEAGATSAPRTTPTKTDSQELAELLLCAVRGPHRPVTRQDFTQLRQGLSTPHRIGLIGRCRASKPSSPPSLRCCSPPPPD